MKNMILFLIGFLSVLYLLLSLFSVFTYGIRKNALETQIADILESTMRMYYGTGDYDGPAGEVRERIARIQPESEERKTLVRTCEMVRGILDVQVTDTFVQPNGITRTMVIEKTLIMEQEWQEDFVMVTFSVGNRTYKTYEVVYGEACPMPKAPDGELLRSWLGEDGEFLGWAMEEDEERVPVVELPSVKKEVRLIAITE